VPSAECLPDTLQRYLSLRLFSSASRFTAGAAAFFILSRSGERPERSGDPFQLLGAPGANGS
jgi:hypothetical protein